jgi:hypothetical protein
MAARLKRIRVEKTTRLTASLENRRKQRIKRET